MQVCLIGPGGTSIPPNGWGAVESIVWDYYENLKSRGISTHIINDPNPNNIISSCNSMNLDIVYIMYDDHIVIAPYLKCKQIFYMSHYAYITQPNFEYTQHYYFNNIFKKVIEYQNFIILNAISEEILNVYKSFGFKGRCNIICNGSRSDKFDFSQNPHFPNKSIYIGKIENRKSQYKYQSITNIDFVGNYHDSSFEKSSSNYLGEWDKPTLYKNLTEYGNLVLLSDGEADPLVVKEALMAGLGVVVSECASANLNTSNGFVTIIPNNRLNDIAYVSEMISKNREISVFNRNRIREYALSTFSWDKIIDRFIGCWDITNLRSLLPTPVTTSTDLCAPLHKNTKTKIALIGPGIMPIPPIGWGAVEILIWDYYNQLMSLGYDVAIINTPDQNEIIHKVNNGNFDFVHLHYDVFFQILEHLKCPKIAITTHYPYIDQVEKHNKDGYAPIFNFLIRQKKYYHFVLADKDYNTFLRYGANQKYLMKMKNGINSKAYNFSEKAILDKTIYLGKITPRKNQAKYQTLDMVDFVGNCDDPSFDISRKNYLSEWSRERLHKELTHYSNLLLLSQGEADPLVVKEALMCGLGIIVNRSSAENLDKELDFITVIEDNKTDDLEYIKQKIVENCNISCLKRSIIREYGITHFDIAKEVKNYVNAIEVY